MSLLSDLLNLSRTPLGSRTETKQCRRCLTVKSIAEFYDQPDGAQGKQPYCIPCMREYKRLRRANGKKN